MVSALKNVKGYALAIVLSAIALPIALRFDVPSSAFLLVAMISCLYGGKNAGRFAVVILITTFDYFFLAPVGHFEMSQASVVRGLTLLGAMVLATELINAKRRSDMTRLQREMEFRSLAETSPDSVFIAQKGLIIQFANPAASKMFGYSAAELEGKPLAVLIPELATDKAPRGEFLVERKDGTKLDVEAVCGAFKDRTTIFLRDISERKRTQRELERSEENLRLILDTIPGIVYSRTADIQVEYVNRHGLEYFGTTLEELRNGAWAEVLHPDERDWVLQEIKRNSSVGQPYTMEHRRRRFDGAYRWFQTSVAPVQDASGNVIRWYGLLTDIDDRRKMEDSLRHTEAKLSHAARLAAAAELSASIVHEISQPIAAMVANGQACIRGLSADPPNIENGMAAVERVVRDGKDAREIIKSLRTLFKKSSPSKAPLNIKELIDEVLSLTKSRVVNERIMLQTDISSDLPLVPGDRIQLMQVLLNLVSNAVDAMHSVEDRPRIVSIQSRAIDNAIVTEVADSGEGIVDFERIFETFFTTKANGMGIGLPICKSIVEAHGGKLWAQRGAQAGSVVSFSIPLS